MTHRANRLPPRVLILALGFAVAFSVAPAPASAAGTAPHVSGSVRGTDVCAMCHRTHTAMGDVQFRTLGDPSTPGNALIVNPTGGKGDAALCYTCHGAEAVGSNTDVQTSFRSRSHHSLEPSVSAYGPSPKQCSDCHDSHGNARTASGTPFPALLRSYGASGAVYTGERYCGTCHPDRARDRWGGLAVYMLTAHYTGIAPPASGTGIRCAVCHDAHGSDIAPLITKTLTPPSVLSTVQVTADDRTFCIDCHPGPEATYPGAGAYQVSAHAVSSKSVTVGGEWASAEATRAVGECQVCHAPMGRSDGSGGAIPKLAERAGPALCLACHAAAGPAATDLAALSYPATAASAPELIAAWDPPTGTAAYGRVAVYSQDPGGAVPHGLVGPREFRPSTGAVGRIAVGDVDGDGRNEVVSADPGGGRLALFTQDPLGGIIVRPGADALPIGATADLIAVADVLPDVSGRPEIAAVDRESQSLYLYRYEGSAMATVAGPLAVGAGASSIAASDVTGTASADIVVTSSGSDRLSVFSDGGGSLVPAGSFATRSQPTGASIGEVWAGNGRNEIVVVNAGETGGQVSIFDGAGTDLHDYTTTGPANAVPTASAIGDVLPGVSPSGTSGNEVVVALSTPTGASAIDVFAQQDGGGLLPASEYETGPRYNSGSLALGDVDGDGRLEVVVGNAGRGTVDGDRQLPSVQVFRADVPGTALDPFGTQTLIGGGVELAGAAPSVAVADLGAVGPSRHPWGAVARTHVSTETAGFAPHVECTDCHDVHESTSTPAAAPIAYGPIKGALGVSVTNESASSLTYTGPRVVRYEYELCFKCHSGWSPLVGGGRNLAFEFDTFNPSVHAVEATASTSQAKAGSFEGSWGDDSVLYCRDCHGDQDATAPKGPHSSADAPILVRPYLGVSPGDPEGLCYKCHRHDVYYTGSADEGTSGSLFTMTTAGVSTPLHKTHTSTWGLGCESCHVSHGSSVLEHLLGPSLGYTHTDTGGTCVDACHPGAGASYAR